MVAALPSPAGWSRGEQSYHVPRTSSRTRCCQAPGPGVGMDGPAGCSGAAGADTGLPLLHWCLLHGPPARVPRQQQRDIMVPIHHGGRAAWRG